MEIGILLSLGNLVYQMLISLILIGINLFFLEICKVFQKKKEEEILLNILLVLLKEKCGEKVSVFEIE